MGKENRFSPEVRERAVRLGGEQDRGGIIAMGDHPVSRGKDRLYGRDATGPGFGRESVIGGNGRA